MAAIVVVRLLNCCGASFGFWFLQWSLLCLGMARVLAYIYRQAEAGKSWSVGQVCRSIFWISFRRVIPGCLRFLAEQKVLGV
jgi:hypothetical protein